MADGYFVDPKTKRVTKGTLVVLQKVGENADGKLHLLAGNDVNTFHLEENDEFFTAIFAVNPFKEFS